MQANMMPFQILISVFGVVLVSFSVEGRNPRVIKDQIATASSPQSDHRHEVIRQSINQQRRPVTSSYEEYKRADTSSTTTSSSSSSSSSSRQKSDQPRLTQQHNFQEEEKRFPASIKNGQSVSSTESSRPTRPISFHIGGRNQRPSRQRRPLRVRVRQYNQTKDEPREYSRPAFDRSKLRNTSPSTPSSYSFANSNIYIGNGNQKSSTHPETDHNNQDNWQSTASPNVYSSSTLITLSTPSTTPMKLNSNKDKDGESNLEVHRMRLLFKRLEEQEKNRKSKDRNSNLETRASRYTSSYSKVSMTQGVEAVTPKYIRPPTHSTSFSSTLRPTFSSTVKSSTLKLTPTSTTDHPNFNNSIMIEDAVEISTLQPSASAPQSINISTYTSITENNDIIHTTNAPVYIANITTTKPIKTTTAASTDNTTDGPEDITASGNFTVPNIYKNTPVSPARLATLGNFNLLGIGGPQQQHKFFPPRQSSLIGGTSSQGDTSNLFGIGSLASFGGLGNFGSLNLGGSTSHSTDNFGKIPGSSGSSLDGLHQSSLGSGASDLGVASLFGGNLGGFSSLGISPSFLDASGATTPKSNTGDLDYLSIISSLGGLSSLGGFGGGLGSGLGGGVGILGGYGGLGGLNGASGLSQLPSHSPSLSLSSLGGSIGQPNQSPNPSSGLNILSSFPNVNLASIGGLSSFPSISGGSNIGKNPGALPSLTSDAAVPSLPAISSISSTSNVPASQVLASSSNDAAASVAEPISVSGDTIKT